MAPSAPASLDTYEHGHHFQAVSLSLQGLIRGVLRSCFPCAAASLPEKAKEPFATVVDYQNPISGARRLACIELDDLACSNSWRHRIVRHGHLEDGRQLSLHQSSPIQLFGAKLDT